MDEYGDGDSSGNDEPISDEDNNSPLPFD